MHNSIKAEHKHSTVVENDVRGSNLEDCVQHYVSSRQNDYYSIVVSGFYESRVTTQSGFAHTVPLKLNGCTVRPLIMLILVPGKNVYLEIHAS